MGLVVDKEYRSKGLGGRILEMAIEQIFEEFVEKFVFGMIGKNHQMIQGYKDERI